MMKEACSYIAGGNTKLHSLHGGELPIPSKITSAFSLSPTLCILDIYAKDTTAKMQNDVYTRLFIASLLQGKQSRCPSIENWLQKLWDFCNQSPMQR